MAVEEKSTKAILLNQVKDIKVPQEYVLDRMTKEYCEKNAKDIAILRLPVAHSELNPIELIWANIKNKVAVKNTTFKMCDVKKLVDDAISEVTPKNWKDAVTHTLKVEKEFWEIDFGSSCPIVEDFVISLNESSSDEESDESSDEDVNMLCK